MREKTNKEDPDVRKEYIFFGAGKQGISRIHEFRNKIKYFCDTNKSGGEVCGIPIIDFASLQHIYEDYQVVVTCGNPGRHSICAVLEKNFIPYILMEELDLREKRVGCNNAFNRDVWIRNILQSIPAGLRILDAGAGEAQYKRYCTHLAYVSQDFCKYHGEGDSHGCQTGIWDISDIDLVCDIECIPEENESFDVIMCTEVLEHIPHPQYAIREFSRLLKHGGKLILTAPFCSLTHFSPFFFSTGFSRYWYENILKEYGFSIDTAESNGNYFEYIAQELRRLSDVSQRYASYTLTDVEQEEIFNVLGILKKISCQDKTSSELLSFGYHVLAQKT